MTRPPTPPRASATGGQVYRLALVMDRLRGPGGCPWDAGQDHTTLVPYLLEEAYEVVDAIETEDRAALREELGDLLLQVVFHAAVARGEPDPFDLDDVAAGIADKLVRRHPHVFNPTDDDVPHLTAEQSHARWDRIKTVEKSRTSVLDGIPCGQGALARTQKVLGRARRGGLDVTAATAPVVARGAGARGADEARDVIVGGGAGGGARGADEARDAIGGALLELVARAEELGVDAEGALRRAMRAVEAEIREQEGVGAGGRAPSGQAPGDPDRGAETTRR